MLNFFKTDDTTRPWYLDPTKLVLLSSTNLAFGDQVVGVASIPQNVQVTNNQALPLNITSISTTAGFAQTDTCGSVVIAGGSCTVSVTFDPATTGAYTGSLTIADDAASSPQVVTLSGTGIASAAPVVSLSSASLSFTAQVIGTSSAAQVVTLTNTGTADLVVSGISASGDFAESDNCVGQNLQPWRPARSTSLLCLP